jgi:hypothetical protein
MLKPLMILWHSVFRVLFLFQIWLNISRFEGMSSIATKSSFGFPVIVHGF